MQHSYSTTLVCLIRLSNNYQKVQMTDGHGTCSFIEGWVKANRCEKVVDVGNFSQIKMFGLFF